MAIFALAMSMLLASGIPDSRALRKIAARDFVAEQKHLNIAATEKRELQCPQHPKTRT